MYKLISMTVSFIYEDGINLDPDITIPTQKHPSPPAEIVDCDLDPEQAQDNTNDAVIPMDLAHDIGDMASIDEVMNSHGGGLLEHTRSLSNADAGTPIQLDMRPLQHSQLSSWSQASVSPNPMLSLGMTPPDYPALSTTYINASTFGSEAPRQSLSEREAQLLHHFILRLAPLVSAQDE